MTPPACPILGAVRRRGTGGPDQYNRRSANGGGVHS